MAVSVLHAKSVIKDVLPPDVGAVGNDPRVVIDPAGGIHVLAEGRGNDTHPKEHTNQRPPVPHFLPSTPTRLLGRRHCVFVYVFSPKA